MARANEVVTEATGEAALQRCGLEPFDLVLLDLGLPDLDGLDVIATAATGTGRHADLRADGPGWCQ